MRNIMILSAVSFLVFFTGCASTSIFPTHSGQAMKSESEFGVLTAQPDGFQGKAIKLAGRMIGVETTAKGTLVTAEWLPYPSSEYVGPAGPQVGASNRFVFFYPGKLDSEGSLHGNKFLVVGKREGSQSIGTFRGTSRSLPYIMARCLHVWKTGDDEIEVQPDVKNSDFPVMEETYCSNT